jgi:hypothetical protein
MKRVIDRGRIIAHHLVISGYGHWLPNDLRGSGSSEVRVRRFEDLGPIHSGRKPKQPSREALRELFKEAEGRLEFPVLWFEEAERAVIGQAVGRVAARRGYTVWACAVLGDHVHVCVCAGASGGLSGDVAGVHRGGV